MQSYGPEAAQLTIFQKPTLKSGPYADTAFTVPDTGHRRKVFTRTYKCKLQS